MQKTTPFFVIAIGLLAACGGGGGGSASGGAQSPTQDVETPAAQTDTPPTTDADETAAPGPDGQPVPVASNPPTTAEDATGPDANPVTVPSNETVEPSPPPPPPPPVALTFFSFDTATSETTAGSGELDVANDRITLADLSGTINSAGTLVDLDDGGQIALLSADTADVGLFQIEPATGNPRFGVYGNPTDFTVFTPDSGASFSGADTAIVQILDGTTIYDLTGDLTASVDFDNSRVSVAIAGLDGQRTDGVSAPVAVTDVAQIGINNALLIGGAYTGGTATFTSAEIAATLSGTESVASRGAIFGEAADEIGGVFVIDDINASGSLLLRGQYVGD